MRRQKLLIVRMSFDLIGVKDIQVVHNAALHHQFSTAVSFVLKMPAILKIGLNGSGHFIRKMNVRDKVSIDWEKERSSALGDFGYSIEGLNPKRRIEGCVCKRFFNAARIPANHSSNFLFQIWSYAIFSVFK